MKWKELPARYKGAEIGGIAVGILEFAYNIVTEREGSMMFNVGAMAAAGAFLGYLTGAAVECAKELYKDIKEENRSISKNKLENSVS